MRRIVFADNRSSRAISASVIVNGGGSFAATVGLAFDRPPPASRGLFVTSPDGVECRTIFRAGLPDMGHPAFVLAAEMFRRLFLQLPAA